jgi:hypothetical protein
LSVLGRVARPFLALAAAVLALAAGGCGGGSGVSSGATVAVYVSAPLCTEAQRELARRGAEVDGVRVQISCLKDVENRGGGVDLATTGADARRAAQDSTTVGFVEEPGPEVGFSRPILEEASIALITDRSGAKAMGSVLAALDSRGSGESPRESVWAGE